MKKHLSLLMLLAALVVPWASKAQVSLPYSTGFETGDDASWTFVNDGTNKWHIGAGAHNTGSQGLYISNNNGSSNAYTISSTQFSYVYRDFTVTAAGQVEIAFDWKANGEGNYDYLRAWLAPTTVTLTAAQDPEGGTSAYNYRESTPSGWIDLGGKMNLQTSWQTTVSEVNLTPGDYRLVFMWANDGSGGTTPPAAIDNVSINMLTCPMPSNIEVASLTAYDATISWQYPDNTASSFNFYYSTSPDFTLDTCSYETVYDTSVTLTNLTPMTTYYYVIQADCGGGDSSRVTAKQHFTTQVDCGQGFANIVDAVSYGTSSAYTQFAYNYNSSSYTVGHAGMIFTAEEMLALGLEGPATINSIKFRAGATPTSVPLRIYVGKTALTEFGSSATDTVGMMSHMTLAFNGTLQTTANEWVTIPLDTLVPYTPDSSLIVYIYRTALPTGNGTFYYTSTSPTYRAFYGYNSSATGRPSYTRTYSRNDIEFDFCYELPTCPRPTNLTYVSADPTSLTLSWNDNTGESYSSYVVDYRQVGSSVWNSVDVYDTTVTLTGLNSAHRYEVRVRAYCGGTDTSMAISGTYLTPCVDLTLDDLPYMQNFDGMTGSTATSPVPEGYLPPCWEIYNHGTRTNYQYCPYVYSNTTYAHSGSNSIRFYSYNSSGDSTQYLILPPIDSTSAQLNELQVSFWLRGNSTSSGYFNNVIVGVMTNPTVEASFIPVDTIESSTTTYAYHEVSFDQYTGPHGRITLKFPKPASSSQYEYGYVDDVTVRVIPTCFWPSVVEVESVGQDGATIVWTPDSRTPNPSGWVVEYGPHGFTRGEGTLDNVYDTVITLTGLDANTLYDIYISADCGGDVSDPAVFSFRTACGALTTLPFTENFDGVTGTTSTSAAVNNLPPCWNYHNVGTSTSYSGYPIVYNSSTYAHSGSQAMRFYTYITAGTYSDQIAIMPMTDSTLYPVNNLQLNFWMRANSTSYNSYVVVGVMTNPTDASTFVPVETIYTNSSTTYAYHEVSFANYTGAHGCITFKFPQPTSGYNYGYVDDVTIETLPACAGITNLEAAATVGSALLTWGYQSGFPEPDGYVVTYDSIGGTNPTVINTNEPTAVITGLAAGATYKVYVQADCGSDGFGRMDSILIATGNFDCLTLDPTTADTVLFSNSTTGQSGCIAYSSWGNTAYQTIYTAAELTAAGLTAGNITGIDLGFTASSSYAKEFTIFIGNTSTTSINSGTFEVPTEAMQVYGPAPHPMNTSGWQHYDFETPFYWNGTSSIIVTTFMNQPAGASHTSSSGLTGYYVSAANKARFRYKDSSPFTLDNVATTGSASTTYSYRAAIHFYKGDCQTYATCAAPAVAVTYVSQDTAELAWIPGYNESEWDVDYRVAGTSSWTNAASGVTATNYTIDGLTPGTDYEFRVSFFCTNDNQLYAGVAEARTPCAPMSLPYTYNFDDLPTGTSSAHPDIPCWHHLNNATSYPGYPYVSSTTPHSGTRNLYWYASNTTGTYGDYQVVVLPPMDTTEISINQMQLSFWARPSSTSYAPVFYVGVMTDPEDINTFVTVDTVNVPSGSTAWDFYEAPLNRYNGHGQYIAVRVNRGSWYAYTDDFMVDVIPTCPHVTNLVVDSVTENTVTLSWTAGDEESLWSVVAGDQYYTTTLPTITISGLVANTAYTFAVRALCGGEDSSIAWTVMGRTACAEYLALPYLEDFESYTNSITAATGVNPDCWHWVMTTTNNGASYLPQMYYYSTTGTYAHSGNYCLRLYGPAYTTLPQLPIDANMVSMGFWTRHTSADYHLIVGVMEHPDSVSTFDTIQVISYTGTSAPEYHEIDFSNYTGTGRYIAFRNYHPSYLYSYHYIDDIEVWQNSSCPSVEGLYAPTVSNNNATVAWTLPENAGYSGVMLYLGTANNMAAATDSVLVTTGTYHTFTGLTGSTTYYVWAQGQCGFENARVRSCSFTTTEDCVPVGNVTVAGLGNTAFGLSWDAPVAGNTPTAYLVYWKAANASVWDSAQVTTPYYYISGLTANTSYQYRVVTVCNDLVSAANSGTVSTLPCGDLITEGGAEHTLLPMYYYYEYSYTQQIYLADEMNDVDTISAISYYYSGNITTPRTIKIYMANTNKASFASTNDYVASSALTEVYNGTISGSGWITLNLTTPFVRVADSNLVIAFDDNTGDYVESTNWGATATSTPRAIYYYQDETDILPSAPTAENMGVLNYVNQILLTGPNCVIPECDRPVVFADSTATDAIRFSWNVETGHNYTVAYRASGDTSWTTVTTTNTTGVCTLTGLASSTIWNVRVSTDCNGTLLTGTANIATLCGPEALPLTEDFEDQPFNTYDRYCWTVGSTNLGTTSPMPRITRLQGSDDKLCLLYNGAYMILPEVDEDLDSLQIRFKLTQGGDNVRLLMGLILDPAAPITAIHVLDTLVRSQIDATTSEVNITYQFAGNVPAAYQHAHIAFWDAFNDNYSFLNDIVVEYVPVCTPATEFTATTTTTTASISWANPGLNATSYVVEYGPRYFTPGTGTMVSGTTSPITLTGLSHSTSYDAYVYTVCGASGDTSVAGQVVRFETECDVITSLPYTMDFENIMSPGSSATNVIPNCWASVGSTDMPHVMYSSTATYYGSPDHCFYFNYLGTAALPQMSAPINTLKVSFRAYNASPSTTGLIIGTVDSIGSGFAASFTPYDTVDFINGTNNVYNVTCYFNDYTGTANRIAIRNISLAGSTTAPVYIDDLVVDTLPSCIAPQHLHVDNLMGTSADLIWNRSNSASYTVLYNVHGNATVTTLTTTNRNVQLTGLTPQTQYDVRVTSDCGDTVSLTFTTPCNAVTLPYAENFDNLTTGTATTNLTVRPNCWDFVLTGSSTYQGASYYPGVYYSSSYAHSGSYSYRLYGQGYHMLPPMPTSLDSLQLTFWDYTTSTSYGLEVGVMEGNNFVPVQTISSPSSTHVEYTVYFGTYTGNSRIIAFRNYYTTSTTTYYSYHYLDNIEVDYLPSCPPVLALTPTSNTTSSLTVDWTDMVTPSSWEVQYSGNGTTNTVIATAHPFTITGLTAASSYQVRVRPICSATDTGDWCAPVSMETGCDLINPPYVQNFDGVTGTTYSTAGNLPPCWGGYTNGTSDAYSPHVVSSGTYWYADSANSLIMTSGNESYGDTKIVRLPQFATPVNTLTLSFWMSTESSTNGYLLVGYMTSLDYNSFVTVDSIHASSTTYHGSSSGVSALGINDTVNFASVPSTAQYLAFKWVYTTSYYSCCIDNVVVTSTGSAVCNAPVIDTLFAGETSAVMSWTGSAANYEVAAVAGTWNDPASGTPVAGNTYTFTGLTPGTQYALGVRAVCSEGIYSDWTVNMITTAEHPCLAPTAVNVTGITISGATVSWTAAEADQTNFQIRYSAAADTTIVDVTTNPYTLTGLLPSTEYSVAVRAVCGEGDYSDWTVAQPFTTASCQPVTGVTVSELTQTTAKVSWTAGSNSNGNYEVAYGIIGTSVQNATRQTVEGSTSYTITGLEEGTGYVVYVRSICAEGVQSDWTSGTTFTTEDEIGIADVDDSRISLYPNPASSTVTLTGIEGAATVTVVDMNGREVYSGNTADGRLTIDVSTLAQGAYFVRITGEQVNAIRKLIVR